MRRLLSLVVVLVLLSGVVALGASGAANSQSAPATRPSDRCVELGKVCPPTEVPRYEIREEGESVFGEGATGESLAAGVLPALPAQPAALALQRVHMAPGSRIETPAGDPRVVLLYVERGALTVRNTVAATVTRGLALATPGAQALETVPADTEFTMTVGDSFLSPAGSGGELRNDGTEEVVLLAGLIVPISDSAATPETGTPVP